MSILLIARFYKYDVTKYSVQLESKPNDLTVTAIDSKTTVSGGDNRKKFPLGATLKVLQNFQLALLLEKLEIKY